MKILLVSLNHAPEQTGIGKYQGEMTSWLTKRGHDVRVVAAPPYYPEWKRADGYGRFSYKAEEIDGARIYRVPIYVPAVQSGARRLVHLASFAVSSFPVIVWQALFWHPEVIMMTAPPLMAAPAVLVAGALSGAKTFMHVQDFEVDAAFNLGLLKKDWIFRFALGVERLFLCAFSRVTSISPRMVDRLLAKGVPSERVALIPNWAGVKDFDPSHGPGKWAQQLNPDGKSAIVLYSGSLGRKQGLEVIIEAARLLQAKPGIRFVISGDGTGREELLKRGAGLGNLTFLPVQPLKDFIHLMIAADIHLLPQKAKAADLVMPSKLGNILASGKPLVAGAEPNTQIYDAIQGCGIAVEPENVQQFADAILKLAGDKPLREKMGQVGRMRAQNDWSRDGILTRLEKLFEGIRDVSPGLGSSAQRAA